MNGYKELYEQGAISKIEYSNEAVEATFQYLNLHGYDILRTLGRGTYGLVAEIERRGPISKSSVAVKIVLEQDVLDSELNTWPKLCHPNLLEFRSWRHLPSAHTYMFLTVKYPTNLRKQLDNANFLLDPRGVDRAVFWLRGIVNGLAYIHDQNLCHLDIKCDNVLISEHDNAAICDFGFLTSAEGLTSKYGSPLIYKAPEATVRSGFRPLVDGRKFDVWTLGLSAMEMFTGHCFSKGASQWPDVSNVYWPKQIYSAIFNMLCKNEFRLLMQKSFTMSAPSNALVDNVISFVISCLNVNPVKRPDVKELLQQKLFEGDQFCSLEDSCVWFKKLSIEKMEQFIEDCRRASISGGEKSNENADNEIDVIHSSVLEMHVEAPSKTVDAAVQTDFVSSEILLDVEESGFIKASETRTTNKKRFFSWAQKKKLNISKLFSCFKKSDC